MADVCGLVTPRIFYGHSNSPSTSLFFTANLLLPAAATTSKKHGLKDTYHWPSETEQLLSGTPAEPSLPLQESHSMVEHIRYTFLTSYSAALDDELIHLKEV